MVKTKGNVKKKVTGTTSTFMKKKVKGKIQEYVKVVIKGRGKTITKQYKYRGGSLKLYEREAKLPRGTKYVVDYNKEKIVRSPKSLERVLKKVKTRKKVQRKKKITLPPLNIIPKKTRHPPKPVEAEKVVDLLNGKVYYERTHDITDFSNTEKESKFLLNILNRATKSKTNAKKLLNNFDKVKLKMSYLVEVDGRNRHGTQERIATMTAVGMRPLEIVQRLSEAGLVPSPNIQNIPYGTKVKGITKEQQTVKGGDFKIDKVNITVKFYNNPQTTLK